MNQRSIFEANLAELEKKDKDLSRRVQGTYHDGKAKVITSKNGLPNVLVKREDSAVLLYDNDDPIGYCRKYLDGLNIKYAPIVVFMGLGLGYHLDIFLKEHGEKLKTREIIIFEKDLHIFRLAMELVDFGHILSHPNIRFFVGDDADASAVYLNADVFVHVANRAAIRSVKIIPLPASVVLGKEHYIRATDTVKSSACQMMVMSGNDSLDSLLGLEHIMINIEHIVSNPGINRLFNKFKGRPGIVIASGPSLAKNMHYLRKLNDKALLISCDASLLPIMRQGIRPHLVTSLERTAGTEQFFLEIDNFEDIYFAVCPVVVPAAFDTFKGQKLISYRRFSHFEWLGLDKGSLYTGPSTANMAFKIAQEAGCDPIILVGQDLAFAKDGDTHVKEAVYGERDEWYHLDIMEIEGNDGKPIKTSKLWNIFRLAYQDDLEAYSGTCINATEGGAKIRSAKIMPLKAAIDRYCTDDFKPQMIIRQALDGWDNDMDIASEMARIKQKCIQTKNDIQQLIHKFESSLVMTRQLEKEVIDPFLNEDIDQDIDKLHAIEKRYFDLSKNLHDERIYDIFAQTAQPYDVWFSAELDFLNNIYTNKKMQAVDRALKIKEWLGVMGQLLVCTRDLLAKAEKKIDEDTKKAA